MKSPEFVDAYSDDVIYLLEGRPALLTHPLRRELPELLNPSTCRLLAVFMIGSIELMLSDWRAKDHNDILKVYFDDKHTNGERINALCAAFQGAGITVDPEVFNDYLAIKYLRNTIVHHKWKDHEKDWLEQRGFPTDTRQLTEDPFLGDCPETGAASFVSALSVLILCRSPLAAMAAVTSITPVGPSRQGNSARFY